MSTDLHDLIQRTVPTGLATPDLDDLARRSRRRRIRRHVTRAGSAVAFVAAGAMVLQGLPRQAVRVSDPLSEASSDESRSSGAEHRDERAPSERFGAGDGTADGSARTEHDGQTIAWDELDLDGAIALLVDRAAMHPGPQLPPSGFVREVAMRGVAYRGVVGPEGEQAWLSPVSATTRTEDDGNRTQGQVEHDRRLDIGTTIAEARPVVGELPRAAVPVGAGADPSAERDQGAIDEAEELAASDEPRREPTDDATERPERSYALVRVADALRDGLVHPGDPGLLPRVFDVLDTVGTEWLVYRGTVVDLLGREMVGFGAVDPANDTETVLLFDPTTGWYAGDVDFHRPAQQGAVAAVPNDGTRTALAEDTRLFGGTAIEVDEFPAG